MSDTSQGKGRPTPKRSEAQKRRGPVAPPPTSRREAAARLREQQATKRQQVREGTRRGDDAVMLKRDQGPVRRLVRDVVDGRRSIAWVLLPVMIITVVAGFTPNANVKAVVNAVWLATLVATAIDMFGTGIDLRRALRAQFPEEKTLGHLGYGLARSTVMRRWRMPRPQLHP